MSNLIPEKRLNKNGVSVTKHVRSDRGNAARTPSMPAPSLAAAPKRKPAFKPRAKQLELNSYAPRIGTFHIDEPLMSKETLERARSSSMYFNAFTARETEIYDVLSVTGPGNATFMLSRQVRTAEEAKTYLRDMNAEHLIEDNSAMTDEMLKRGVPSDDFMSAYNAMPEEERLSPHLFDAIELGTISSLRGGESVRRWVLSGEIKLEDIKALGISKLKSYDRLYDMRGLLMGLHKEDAKYDIDDLKRLIDRVHGGGLKSSVLSTLMMYMDHKGPELLDRVEDLERLSRVHREYRLDRNKKQYDHVLDRAAYDVLLAQQLTDGKPRFLYFSDDLYEAGIEVDEAARLINSGLTLQQAIASHNGIALSVADGWI